MATAQRDIPNQLDTWQILVSRRLTYVLVCTYNARPRLPLCGVAMRLESSKRPLEFTIDIITDTTHRECVRPVKKTVILSDPLT